jgi:hypothetical protein
MVNGAKICMMRVLLALFGKEIYGNAYVAEHFRGCGVDRGLSELEVANRRRLAPEQLVRFDVGKYRGCLTLVSSPNDSGGCTTVRIQKAVSL